MKTRPPISVTVVTRDEEAHIGDCIKSVLSWADEVVVVDSGSTDKTREIARNLGAKVFENPWRGYGQQKNFAQAQTTHEWILNLDADERATPELKAEIDAQLNSGAPGASVYRIPRKNFYLGHWVRHGGWYPNFTARFGRRSHSQWTEPELHEELVAIHTSSVEHTLKGDILHYSFRSVHDQIETNSRYSRLGALELLKRGERGSVFKLLIKPVGKFFETYLLKAGFLDGLAGLIISVNAAYSLFLKYAYVLEQTHLKKETHESPHCR